MVTTNEKIQFWLTYLIFGGVYFLIFRGFIRMVLGHIRLIRAKLQHLKETDAAAGKVTEQIVSLKNNKDGDK